MPAGGSLSPTANFVKGSLNLIQKGTIVPPGGPLEESPVERHKVALFIIGAVLILLGVASYAAANYAPAVPLTNVQNNPLLLGVINAKGEWILPPAFEEIIYVKKHDAFWVKESEPSMAKYFWPPNFLNSLGKNKNWKLVDKNGKEIGSHLPEGQDVLREYPPTQATGVSFYDDAIVTNGKEGAGLNEYNGKPLTAANYHRLAYVGENMWVGSPGRDEDATTEEKMFPSITLGNPMHLPPAVVLLDNEGKRVAKLPKGIFGPDGYFVNDILVCQVMGAPSCAIHKTGRIAYSPGAALPDFVRNRFFKPGQPRSFNSFYNLPVSKDKPIKFVDISKKGNYPSEIIPKAVAENIALVSTENDMFGLVSNKGDWLLAPDYNRLAYCSSDRFICSKGTITKEQRKKQQVALGQPDIR